MDLIPLNEPITSAETHAHTNTHTQYIMQAKLQGVSQDALTLYVRSGSAFLKAPMTIQRVFQSCDPHLGKRLQLSQFSSTIHVKQACTPLYSIFHSWKTKKLLLVQIILFYGIH